jgi:hypothetical protein
MEGARFLDEMNGGGAQGSGEEYAMGAVDRLLAQAMVVPGCRSQ